MRRSTNRRLRRGLLALAAVVTGLTVHALGVLAGQPWSAVLALSLLACWLVQTTRVPRRRSGRHAGH